MLNDVYHTTLAQVSAYTRHSILIPSMVLGWLFSRRFSVPRFVPFRVSLLHLALLFPLVPVLCPEPLLPCGRRQGKHYLRLRQPRSLGPWPNSPLTHEEYCSVAIQNPLTHTVAQAREFVLRQREVGCTLVDS